MELFDWAQKAELEVIAKMDNMKIFDSCPLNEPHGNQTAIYVRRDKEDAIFSPCEDHLQWFFERSFEEYKG